MTIREIEEQLGIPRATVRYYEREGLLAPVRGGNNYRDYTEEDLNTLEKIRLLRRLDMPLDTIKAVQRGEVPLREALERQEKLLEEDWEWRAMKERQTALETAFRARHRGNRALLLEVNDLLDALCLQHFSSLHGLPDHQTGCNQCDICSLTQGNTLSDSKLIGCRIVEDRGCQSAESQVYRTLILDRSLNSSPGLNVICRI